MNATLAGHLEIMNAALPETGEMLFQNFEVAVRAENPQALGSFHLMRRSGLIGSRLSKREGGGLELYVSRVEGSA